MFLETSAERVKLLRAGFTEEEIRALYLMLNDLELKTEGSSMIECLDCGVYFFTTEGRQDHEKWCIGYRPENEGEYTRRALRSPVHPDFVREVS